MKVLAFGGDSKLQITFLEGSTGKKNSSMKRI